MQERAMTSWRPPCNDFMAAPAVGAMTARCRGGHPSRYYHAVATLGCCLRGLAVVRAAAACPRHARTGAERRVIGDARRPLGLVAGGCAAAGRGAGAAGATAGG